VIAVNVFDHEAFISGIFLSSQLEEGKVLPVCQGSILMKKVELPKRIPVYHLWLVVSLLEGDAYDRTGSILVIPTAESVLSLMPALCKESLPIYRDKREILMRGW
jgi:hypothetical protein